MALVYSPEVIQSYLRHACSRESVCKKHPISVVIQTEGNLYVPGWNGAPTGVRHDECARKGYASGMGMELCLTIHAERRAISFAAKTGVCIDKGAIFLNEWFPCADCAKSIVEAGLTTLVTPDEFYQDEKKRILIPKLQKQPYNFEMAERILTETGVGLIVDPRIRP